MSTHLQRYDLSQQQYCIVLYCIVWYCIVLYCIEPATVVWLAREEHLLPALPPAFMHTCMRPFPFSLPLFAQLFHSY